MEVAPFFAMLDLSETSLCVLKTAETLVAGSPYQSQQIHSAARRLQDTLACVVQHYEDMLENGHGHNAICSTAGQDPCGLKQSLNEAVLIPKWCFGAVVELDRRGGTKKYSNHIPSLARVKQLILLALSRQSDEEKTLQACEQRITQISHSQTENGLSNRGTHSISTQEQEDGRNKGARTSFVKREADSGIIMEEDTSKPKGKLMKGPSGPASRNSHRAWGGTSTTALGHKGLTATERRSGHPLTLQQRNSRGSGALEILPSAVPKIYKSESSSNSPAQPEPTQHTVEPKLDKELQEQLDRTMRESTEFWEDLTELKDILSGVRNELNHLEGCTRPRG